MRTILTKSLCVAVAIVAIGSLQVDAAIFDDFSDLNDTANPTWTHLSGNVGSTGQTWDASTGQYRLTAPSNAVLPPPFNVLNGYGFVGSHTGPVFSDVSVMADFVDFPKGVFGVAARLNGANGANQLTGYGYAYEPFAAGGLGEMVLYQITGASLTDIGSQQVTLDPNKDYTFILNAFGTQIHGRVFEIGGGMVAERVVTNAAWASGTSGVFGYSHISIYDQTDFTVDNFKTRVPEPTTILLGAFTAGVALLSRRFRGRR